MYLVTGATGNVGGEVVRQLVAGGHRVRAAVRQPDAVLPEVRDGFEHGGWGTQYADAELGQAMRAGMAETSAQLLGRRTYEDFYSYWPKQTDNPYSEVLNNVRKYVVSRTLTEPLPWQNSTLLTGDLAESVIGVRDAASAAASWYAA